jgi:hypothetical protein
LKKILINGKLELFGLTILFFRVEEPQQSARDIRKHTPNAEDAGEKRTTSKNTNALVVGTLLREQENVFIG